MFKKTVTFEDFDGVKQTRDFYFHISKAELIALATSADDMQTRIKRMIDAKDGAAILKELRDFIKLSVGVRSEDGGRFIKDEAAQSTLFDSPAYDELLMELATDANKCSDFMRQLIPEKMQKEMQEQLKNGDIPHSLTDKEDYRPAYIKEDRAPTHTELLAMDKPQMIAAMTWAQQNGK